MKRQLLLASEWKKILKMCRRIALTCPFSLPFRWKICSETMLHMLWNRRESAKYIDWLSISLGDLILNFIGGVSIVSFAETKGRTMPCPPWASCFYHFACILLYTYMCRRFMCRDCKCGDKSSSLDSFCDINRKKRISSYCKSGWMEAISSSVCGTRELNCREK